MTSLRTFQNEIEEIHTRELAKQRAAGHATVTVNDREKENKRPLTDAPLSPGVNKTPTTTEEVDEVDENSEGLLVSYDVN
jgi:hypothetical protein